MSEDANDVTVVVTCFNQALYIRQAVDSVCRQTHRPTRILVVDDASTDAATITTLRNLESVDRVEVVRRERNGGPGATRNTGLSRVRTDFVVMLDGDDMLEPEFIEVVSSALKASGDNLAASSWMATFGVLESTVKPAGGGLTEFLTRNCAPATAMFRVSALRRSGGYDESMRKGFEDWDCCLSLLEAGSGRSAIAVVPQPLIRYRTAPASSNVKSMGSRLELMRYLVGKHRNSYIGHLEEVILGLEQAGSERLSMWKALMGCAVDRGAVDPGSEAFMASPSYGDGGMAAAVEIASKRGPKSL